MPAIVNQTWVREFLPKGPDPVGQAFQEGDGSKVEIVGVVADARQNAQEHERSGICSGARESRSVTLMFSQ